MILKNYAFLVPHIFHHLAGTERVVYNLATEFSKINKVSIIAVDNFLGDDWFIPDWVSSNINYSVIYNKNTFVDKIKKVFLDDLTKKLKEYCEVNKIDTLILTITSFLSILNLDELRKAVPVIILHNHFSADVLALELNKPIPKLFSNKVEKNKKSLSAIVALTDFDARKLRMIFPDTLIKTIYNAVAMPQVTAKPAEHKTIIYVGRLEETDKQVSHLLKAFKKAVAQDNSWVLKIYGDGSSKTDYIEWCKQNGITNSVYFCGTEYDLNTIFLEAAFLVLTSKQEGFGLVLVEAQSFGIPVIAYKCSGGMEEIVSANSGILVEPGNIHALAEAMLELIGDDRKRMRMGENAKKQSIKFSESKIFNSWEELVSRL